MSQKIIIYTSKYTGFNMKAVNWILPFCLITHSLWAEYSDPFAAKHATRAKKVQTSKKYQYLGYIQGPGQTWGFVREVGGEIERVSYGKNLGFGKVVSFSKQTICISKQNQKWCLQRSAQATNWKLLRSGAKA